MSRPLNEYPKEELEDLINAVSWFSLSNASNERSYPSLHKWVDEISMAIKDREFEDSRLPDERK